MPRLTTVDVRGLEECMRDDEGMKQTGEDCRTVNGVTDREKEEGKTEGAQRPGRQMNVHRRAGSTWWYITPAVGVWLILQKEAPLYLSLTPWEVGGRLLQVALIVGFITLIHQFIHHRIIHQQEVVLPHSEEILKESATEQNTCMMPERSAGHLESVVDALSNGLSTCLLHESLGDPSLTQIQALHSKLQAIWRVVSRADSLWQDLSSQDRAGGEKTPEDGRALIGKAKRISAYLQDRVGVLNSLLQVQGEYEVLVQATQEDLMQHWDQLVNLHTRVTISPNSSQEPDDLQAVLRDTEELFTELRQLKAMVQHSQRCLKTCTVLLQELDRGQQALAESINTEPESTWTTDLSESNAKQLDKLQEDFASLEQQTSTFVTHLRGLGESGKKQEVTERSQGSASSTPHSAPIFTSSLALESSALNSVPPPSLSVSRKPLGKPLDILRGMKKRKKK